MKAAGWIDIRPDQLRIAAQLATEYDATSTMLLRLEYLSDGTLVLHQFGMDRIVVVSPAK